MKNHKSAWKAENMKNWLKSEEFPWELREFLLVCFWAWRGWIVFVNKLMDANIVVEQ